MAGRASQGGPRHGRHRPQKFRRVGQTTPPGTPCLALVFAGEMRAPRRTRRGLAGRGVVEVAGRGWKERTTTHHETAITRNSTWLLLLLQSRTPPPRALARTHAHADPLSRPLRPPFPSLHTAKGEWAADCASCQQLCGEFNVRAIRQRLLLQSRMPPPLRARTRTHAHTDPLFRPLLPPLPSLHTAAGEWAADCACC